jgi:transposase
MAKAQVEVITSVERRRRWSSAEKEQLVAASLEPGAVVSALAREAGLHPSQLYKWRRQLCARQGSASRFMPVQIIGEPAAPGLPAPVGVIEIGACRRNAAADHRRG